MNLQNRIVNILMKPNEEWPVIADEATDVATLYKEYIAVMAAIPAICGFLGVVILGINLPVVGAYRVSISSALTGMVVQYVLSLAGIYLAAIIIDQLAPNFQSSGGLIQALKVVAYGATPSWVAGVLGLIPALGILGAIASLYGIYLVYLGLPPVMKTPPEKVLPFMAVSAVVVVVIFVVIQSVAGMMLEIPRPS
ncbi:MAG: Yip1 family protein [Terriglobia bacterium]